MKQNLIFICLSLLVSSFLLSDVQARTKRRCGVDYYCEKMGPACCGNGICQPDEGENCDNCPEDCGKCASCEFCGNNLCEVNESPCNCPQDCGPCCCDGKCSFPETYENCPLECSGTAYIQAIDYESGNPLTGVNVTCSSWATGELPELLTDTDGSAVFGDLEPSNYACAGSLTGYDSNSAAVEVTPGSRIAGPTLLPLKKQTTGTITGYVRYNFASYPAGVLRGINVTCADQDTISDRFGRFYFLRARLGSLSCFAEGPGYQRAIFNVNVTAGQNTDVTVPVSPASGAITFYVVDAQTETPLRDVTATCSDVERRTWTLTGTSAASGLATLNNVFLERGCTVSCTFAYPGYLSTTDFFNAEKGEINYFHVSLSQDPTTVSK
eukprot:TRINITY_DN1402_c0_g1_i1.p1 TRINITY_DN1402_c0_g1~~TRINITY_DN1402_c0_g1_i1.p1  ORF type:complete len:382 (-),score=106.67 TRINITY_DN1402_c0_g1_i1:224-1369(-)